jgi:mRNA-degrading endonuclease RelE of RelBE toxin-antitoxin system
MADKIKKLLAKLSKQERNIVKLLILRIMMNDTLGLNISQLKGHKNLFRVKKNKIRIIYSKNNQNIQIIRIDRRNEKTYKDL